MEGQMMEQARIAQQKLVENGERERLKNLMAQKLLDSGWNDQLKSYAKNIVNSKGAENITLEELISQITNQGRATVSNEVKTELLQHIIQCLQQYM